VAGECSGVTAEARCRRSCDEYCDCHGTKCTTRLENITK